MNYKRILSILCMALGLAGCDKSTDTLTGPDNPTPPPTAQGGNISFAGHEWQVKDSLNSAVGPGPNYFSGSNVSVDSQGRLHLKIRRVDSQWRCAEVILNQSLGYGRYMFELEGGFENIDQNAVLGLFTWDTNAPPQYRELDIEFSRWSVPNNQNGQFVVQPYTNPANIFRFQFGSFGTSLHTINWSENKVEFQSSGGGQSVSWEYKNASGIPNPGNENIRINLWLFNGAPPTNNQEVEVVIRSFRYVR